MKRRFEGVKSKFGLGPKKPPPAPTPDDDRSPALRNFDLDSSSSAAPATSWRAKTTGNAPSVSSNEFSSTAKTSDGPGTSSMRTRASSSNAPAVSMKDSTSAWQGLRTSTNAPAVAMKEVGEGRRVKSLNNGDLLKSKVSSSTSSTAQKITTTALPKKKETTSNASAVLNFFTSSSSFTKKESAKNEPVVTLSALESLDDFSLFRLLDKRLFSDDDPDAWKETVLVIRLAKPSMSSLKAVSGRVLASTKSTKPNKKKELLLVVTRFPEFSVHGVASDEQANFSLSWSFDLSSLLALREAKRGETIVVQFAGGKERKFNPLDDVEKAWVFYGLVRLCREFAGGDPVVITMTALKKVANEDSLKTRCPMLLTAVSFADASMDEKTTQSKKSFSTPARGKFNALVDTPPRWGVDVSSVSKGSALDEYYPEREDDNDITAILSLDQNSTILGQSGMDLNVSVGSASFALSPSRPANLSSSLIASLNEGSFAAGWKSRTPAKRVVLISNFAQEDELDADERCAVEEAFKPKSSKESPMEMIERVKEMMNRNENDTLNELRSWESMTQQPAAAAALGLVRSGSSKSLTDMHHGRRGDPIASLLAHLEDVDTKLCAFDDWIHENEGSVRKMTTIAKSVDLEIRRLRKENDARGKLREYLIDLLQDIPPQEEKVILDLNTLLPTIQKELESSFAGSAASAQALQTMSMIVNACNSIVELKEKDDEATSRGNIILYARRERMVRIRDLTDTVALKLSDFFQSRFDYYYKFERGKVGDVSTATHTVESHVRLLRYADMIRALERLSPDHSQAVRARYASEAAAFMKSSLLSKSKNSFYFSTVTSTAAQQDSIAKFPDSVVESPESYRPERELALKELHQSTVDARFALLTRIHEIVEEETAFCLALECNYDVAPAVKEFMDALWEALSAKVNTHPLSFGAAVMCDFERFAKTYERNARRNLGKIIRESAVNRTRTVFDRFMNDYVYVFFEKNKKQLMAAVQNSANTPDATTAALAASAVFVRKLPALIDRLDAVSRGPPSTFWLVESNEVHCPGGKVSCERVLDVVLKTCAGEPYQIAENLFFLQMALRPRAVASLQPVLLSLDNELDAVLKEIVKLAIRYTPFQSVVKIAQSCEDDFAVNRHELNEALAGLQSGGLERHTLGVRVLVDSRLLDRRLRSRVAESCRDLVIESYWRVAEFAAENYGLVVQPPASAVRDAWAKVCG